MAKFSTKEYYMGRDKTHKAELTSEVEANVAKFIPVINKFFEELGHTSPAYVSSGWRPGSINSGVKGAAKRSLHTLGLAIDIRDPDGKLYDLVVSRPDLLRKYGLWVEHGEFSKGWLHLDMGTRVDRPSRVFKP